MNMRKIFIILLICALILGCAGVVTALEITISPQSPKVGEMVTFTANNPPDNVTRYEWSIEGVTKTDNQVTHTFDKTGTYTVIVTAYNESIKIGEKNTTFSVTENTPIKPVLKNFVGNKTSGPAPLTIQFTVETTNGSPTEYVWDFGSGYTQTTKTGSTIYTYTSAGDYTVNVIAKNGSVESEKETTTIHVTDSPVPTITELKSNTTNGYAPLSVLFTATATNSPTEYQWTFGDGTSETETTTNTITHEFKKTGTYTVNVTAKNTNGTSEKKSTTIVVNANASNYKVSIDATPVKGIAPLTVKFKLNTTIPDEDISEVDWDFGVDNKSLISKNDPAYKSPSWTYEEDGNYKVTLTVKSALTNEEYQADVMISVSDVVASFTASTTSGTAPLEVKFTDTSTGATAWTWNIYKTDGGSRTLQKELTDRNITYTFQNKGTYEVELIAKKESNTATESKTITVTAKATTVPTTVKTTAPTTAATTVQAVKSAFLSADDNPIPNPLDIIEELIRLLKVMLVPENYSLA